MKDIDIIKKKYGENFAKLCRSLFPTILENEGELSEIIQSKFAPNRSLYDDLTSEEDGVEWFKGFVFSSIARKNLRESREIDETPEQLMEKAGYTLIKCETVEDVEKFMRYYQPQEQLCTFNDHDRINNFTIFFAVKKNVDEIKRENFDHPRRQDEYGTSVISLQFSKDEFCTLSIKNRYNHTVDNPDATFSNDLENIYPGLTDSFETYYGLSPQDSEEYFFSIEDKYTLANDGKYYRYNRDCDGIYFCSDNIVVKDGEVIQYDKGRYELVDCYLIDKKENTIMSIYGMSDDDCFLDYHKNIEKIEVTKCGPNGERLITLTIQDQEPVFIKVNKFNQIIEYENKNITEIGDNFLSHSSEIEKINLPNVTTIGNYFLYSNNLQEFNAPQLISMGNACLSSCYSLQSLSIPQLRIVGDGFLTACYSVPEFNAPHLLTIGDDFMGFNRSLESFIAPELTTIGNNFLRNHTSTDLHFVASRLHSVGPGYFEDNYENQSLLQEIVANNGQDRTL